MGYLDSTALSNVLTKLKTWLNSNVANKSHNHTKSEITDFPTNVSAFNNDNGYLTSHQDISGKVNKTGDTISGAFTFGNEDSILDSTHIEFNVLTDNSEVDAYKAGFYSETDTELLKTEVKSNGIIVDCGSEGKASIAKGTITGDVVKTTAGADLDSVNNALSGKIGSDISDMKIYRSGSVSSADWLPAWDKSDDSGRTIRAINPSNLSVGYASSADNANYVKYDYGNEINFKGGRQSSCWFNYRNADDDSKDISQIVDYCFCDYAGNANGNLKCGSVNGGTPITSNNIGSQSVNYASNANYANSSGNADTLDGRHDYGYMMVRRSSDVGGDGLTPDGMMDGYFSTGMIRGGAGNAFGDRWTHYINLGWNVGGTDWNSQIAIDVEGKSGIKYRPYNSTFDWRTLVENNIEHSIGYGKLNDTPYHGNCDFGPTYGNSYGVWLCQGEDGSEEETSGIHLSGDGVNIWCPPDNWALAFWNEDNDYQHPRWAIAGNGDLYSYNDGYDNYRICRTKWTRHASLHTANRSCTFPYLDDDLPIYEVMIVSKGTYMTTKTVAYSALPDSAITWVDGASNDATYLALSISKQGVTLNEYREWGSDALGSVNVQIYIR